MINNLLYETQDKRKKQILQDLKACNKEANEFMLNVHLRYKSFKYKYNRLQKKYVWTKARNLLLEWFNNPHECMFCHKPTTRLILHHIKYTLSDTFTPSFVRFICESCHIKAHNNNTNI